jgi:hypothetical protein
MLRPLWHMLQITHTAFGTSARAGPRSPLCRSLSKTCAVLKPSFWSSWTAARPAVSFLSSLGSATAAVTQQEQSAIPASVASFTQTRGLHRSRQRRGVAAAGRSGSMQPQQQQYSHLLMSPEQQQQLLESVKDRPPVIFYHYPCTDGEGLLLLAASPCVLLSSRGVWLLAGANLHVPHIFLPNLPAYFAMRHPHAYSMQAVTTHPLVRRPASVTSIDTVLLQAPCPPFMHPPFFPHPPIPISTTTTPTPLTTTTQASLTLPPSQSPPPPRHTRCVCCTGGHAALCCTWRDTHLHPTRGVQAGGPAAAAAAGEGCRGAG